MRGIGEYERRLLGLAPEDASPTLYRPGRDASGGYRGRTGIYELIVIDDTLRTMIHDGVGEHERYWRLGQLLVLLNEPVSENSGSTPSLVRLRS